MQVRACRFTPGGLFMSAPDPPVDPKVAFPAQRWCLEDCLGALPTPLRVSDTQPRTGRTLELLFLSGNVAVEDLDDASYVAINIGVCTSSRDRYPCSK
jgi:hypothetical protein